MLDYKLHIRETPNFPIPGVLFRDINPLLADPKLFAQMLEDFTNLFELSHIDAFVGIESRGFILASALAAITQKGFIPLRKAGKLPPPLHQESYLLEYGSAILEMQAGLGHVVIIDDVLATGGTLQAAIKLCEKSGYTIQDIGVLINLKSLNQLRFKGSEIKSLIQYEN